jgi:large subunit ribosomal protein L9
MATKLLLIEDVEDLGRSGDVVSVRPGFARNFLLPQGVAVIADRVTLRKQKLLQEEREKRAAVDKQEAEQTASGLNELVLTKIVKVDHEGHMYGSVSAHDVADLLQQQSNITLEKRAIGLKHPIKETGVHHIAIKLKEGVTASITLKVVSELDQQNEEQPSA